MMDISKDIGHKSSTRQQIKYYKSISQENLIPINIDEIRKKTGTISLLTLTYPQNNSTNYLKQKSKLFQKLDSFNKKLRKTLKQLQVTTSKSFINFNFNHTQYKELFPSTTTTQTFFNNHRINDNDNDNSHSYEQKDSKISYSSIPSSYHDNIIIDSKINNENNNSGINIKKENEESEVSEESEISEESEVSEEERIEEVYKSKNEDKKHKNIRNDIISFSRKDTTLKIQSKKIYSSFLNIPFSKSTMKLDELKQQSDSTNEISIESESILDNNIIEKENKKEKETDNKNVNQEKEEEKEKEKEIKKNNETETLENNAHTIKNLKFEKSLFASPEHIALILFILYATFVF